MHFIFTAHDKAGALEIRLANRDDHVAFLKDNAATIKVAGPLLSDDGQMIGSSLICEAEDKAALEAVMATDPYAKAGLFESSSIVPWKWVIGAPE
ncbi:YciI family protein [Cohaesibacter celericrescens]|uniref:YCII-related domain-containing protein n=1 Tax=Cohaesibacter celericrescens TaxID=2067669 RepID=A0A2N5XPC7_9HYPH|nr:YciI family protein [Cohaesibacter celericrescens]PLW76287.1 hypothetical protein C0081_15440 [Cohaesibacter celericrescens]